MAQALTTIAVTAPTKRASTSRLPSQCSPRPG